MTPEQLKEYKEWLARCIDKFNKRADRALERNDEEQYFIHSERAHTFQDALDHFSWMGLSSEDDGFNYTI